jgi:hypothetical protein
LIPNFQLSAIETSMPDIPETPPRNTLGTVLRTGLLIAGSALFGGLAVVLWNRKALAGLRQLPPHPETPPIHRQRSVHEDESEK